MKKGSRGSLSLIAAPFQGRKISGSYSALGGTKLGTVMSSASPKK